MKNSEKEKHLIEGPMDFMVTDLPFCSHEEFIGLNGKVSECRTCKWHYHISRNRIPFIRDPSEQSKVKDERFQVSLFKSKCYIYHLNNISWFKSNGSKIINNMFHLSFPCLPFPFLPFPFLPFPSLPFSFVFPFPFCFFSFPFFCIFSLPINFVLN